MLFLLKSCTGILGVLSAYVYLLPFLWTCQHEQANAGILLHTLHTAESMMMNAIKNGPCTPRTLADQPPPVYPAPPVYPSDQPPLCCFQHLLATHGTTEYIQ